MRQYGKIQPNIQTQPCKGNIMVELHPEKQTQPCKGGILVELHIGKQTQPCRGDIMVKYTPENKPNTVGASVW
jgi:hypothetical protein